MRRANTCERIYVRARAELMISDLKLYLGTKYSDSQQLKELQVTTSVPVPQVRELLFDRTVLP